MPRPSKNFLTLRYPLPSNPLNTLCASVFSPNKHTIMLMNRHGKTPSKMLQENFKQIKLIMKVGFRMKILCNLLPTVIEILFTPLFTLITWHNMLVPVAVQSKVRVCGRLPVVNVVCCQVEVSATG